MDVFDFAMKMELDGKAWYERQAAQTQNKVLKDLLLEMARDEEGHYALFKGLKENLAAGGSVNQTHVLVNAKNLFEKMAQEGSEVVTEDLEVWKQLRDNEKDAEKFYREKAAEAESEGARKALELIADEEHKHTVLIDNVIEFLERPSDWLENAEWRHIESY